MAFLLHIDDVNTTLKELKELRFNVGKEAQTAKAPWWGDLTFNYWDQTDNLTIEVIDDEDDSIGSKTTSISSLISDSGTTKEILVGADDLEDSVRIRLSARRVADLGPEQLIVELKRQIADQKKEIERLQNSNKEVENLKKTIAEQEKELNQLKKEKELVIAERARIEDKHLELINGVNTTHQLVTSLRDEIENYKQTISEVQDRIEDTEQKYEREAQEKLNLRALVLTYREQIADLTNDHDSESKDVNYFKQKFITEKAKLVIQCQEICSKLAEECNQKLQSQERIIDDLHELNNQLASGQAQQTPSISNNEDFEYFLDHVADLLDITSSFDTIDEYQAQILNAIEELCQPSYKEQMQNNIINIQQLQISKLDSKVKQYETDFRRIGRGLDLVKEIDLNSTPIAVLTEDICKKVNAPITLSFSSLQ